MPIYEYRCENCGHELEKIQKFSDAPLTDCPHCGKASLKKLVSAAAFKLTGTGWYETDFKNPKKDKASTTTSTETAGDTTPTTEVSSDAKPATETKDTKKAETTPE